MELVGFFKVAVPAPLFIFLLLHLVLLSSNCDGRAMLCRARESEALIRFRDELSWGDKMLPWGVGGEDDCCMWNGIGCNNRSGHVVSLDLRGGVHGYPGDNYVYGVPLLRGKIGSSLAALKYLRRLDLSGNDFEGSSIPPFFGSFERLAYLDLSNANFSGVVSQHLGNLSSLQVLNLSDIYRIESNGEWFSRLHKLRFLELSFTNLTGVNNLLKALNMLPFLESLHLHFARGSDTRLLYLQHVNFTRLANLSITGLNFTNACWLSHITSLEYLELVSNYMLVDACRNDFTAKLCNLKSLTLQDNAMGTMRDLNQFFTECNKRLNLVSLESFDSFIGQLPGWLGDYKNLQTLRLRDNDLSGSIPESIGGMTSLKILDLSRTYLTGSIPLSIGGLQSLEYLFLAETNLTGSIPQSIGELQSLKKLDLTRSNNLMASIPQSIGRLNSLKMLFLSEANLTGSIPQSIGGLRSLVLLDLSGNNLMGSIPQSIGRLQSLIHLYLYENKLMGSIPQSIGDLQSLVQLDLSQNNLSGPLPSSLGELKSLRELYLSGNHLQGNLSEEHFVHLGNLTDLDLSTNSLLQVTLSPHWVPPFSLVRLYLGSCKVGPDFPLWLQTQNQLEVLNMSDSGISDVLPPWIWNFSSQLNRIDLSMNTLTGIVPVTPNSSKMWEIILQSNRLQGSLLSFSRVQGALFLSHNLFSGPIDVDISNLDRLFLSNNSFTGGIPPSFCEAKGLKYLDLSHNILSGQLPSCSANQTCHIVSLHLNNNNLHGTIPAWLWNCTEMGLLDMGENNFSGEIPNWISSGMLRLKVLRLRSNSFYGSIPMELSNLTSIQVLDLACNNFSGPIPPTFGNFSAMNLPLLGNETLGYSYGGYYQESIMVASKGKDRPEPESILKLFTSIDLSGNKLSGNIPAEVGRLVYLRNLNLSHNHLHGCIPETFAKLSQLESFDLSGNNLSGGISQTLSVLTFMSIFNVSFNNLSGRIPSGGQFDTYPNSSFMGNLNLCGKPLQTVCPSDLSPPVKGKNVQTDQNDDEHYFLWLSLSVILGFIMGFWTFLGTLFFKSNWRYAYFQFVDCQCEKCYQLAKIYVDKYRRMYRRS